MYEGRNLGHDDAAPLQSRTSDVRFSDFRILRCRTTRARFASVTIFWLSPAFQRAASRGRGGYVCLARTFVTN